MHTSRSGHYFTWFIIFGAIAGVVSLLGQHTVSSEALWLLISGVLGMLLANKRLGDVGRYYDFIIGVLFTLAGLAGLVYNINASWLPSALASSQIIIGKAQDATLLGLSLAVVPSALHLILGVISFQHGLNNSAKSK